MGGIPGVSFSHTLAPAVVTRFVLAPPGCAGPSPSFITLRDQDPAPPDPQISITSTEVKYSCGSSSPGVFVESCDVTVSFFLEGRQTSRHCSPCFGEMQKNVIEVFSEALQT